MKRLCITATLLGLVGCGQLTESPLLSQATEMLGFGSAEASAAPQSNVTEEQILDNPGAYLRVNVRDLGIWDTMSAVATNGDRTTWAGVSGIGVTVEEGIVVATRGLPRDLMGAEASGTLQAIRNGGGQAERVHDVLDDQDQTVTYMLSCDIVRKDAEPVNRLGQSLTAVRYEERCTTEGLALTNIYWVDRSGRILRSLQAVSPDAGYLQLDAF